MASRLVDGGADLSTVQAAGGWTEPNSVQHYAKPGASLVRMEYQKAMQQSRENKKRNKTKVIGLQEYAQSRRLTANR